MVIQRTGRVGDACVAPTEKVNTPLAATIPREGGAMPREFRSFEEFRAFVSETLGVSEQVLTPEAHFLYDLGIESLKLVELLLQLELRLGRQIPIDTAWQIETLGDAYKFYTEQVQAA
jgi:acyl carrier protein